MSAAKMHALLIANAAFWTAIGGRAYPHISPRAVVPYAVYQVIALSPNNTLSDGIHSRASAVQLDIYAATRASADQIAALAETSLQYAAALTGGFSAQDADSATFRNSSTWSIIT